jgi:plasmid replication initiation protein
MYPLEEVWDDAGKRLLVIESINSMSDAVLDYKNLHLIKKIVNN